LTCPFNGRLSELILSKFVDEPTLVSAGNLYFVHNFNRRNTMIEANIYAAYQKMSLKIYF
jgi:hypothetical protein